MSLQDAASDGRGLVAEGDGSNDSGDYTTTNEDKKPLLKKYISSFDRATLVEMHRVMSQEGRGLIDRQITALWGDAKDLQEEMQEVCFGSTRNRGSHGAHVKPFGHDLDSFKTSLPECALTGILAQVIGVDASSVEELMQRADEAVIEDRVQVCSQAI